MNGRAWLTVYMLTSTAPLLLFLPPSLPALTLCHSFTYLHVAWEDTSGKVILYHFFLCLLAFLCGPSDVPVCGDEVLDKVKCFYCFHNLFWYFNAFFMIRFPFEAGGGSELWKACGCVWLSEERIMYEYLTHYCPQFLLFPCLFRFSSTYRIILIPLCSTFSILIVSFICSVRSYYSIFGRHQGG